MKKLKVVLLAGIVCLPLLAQQQVRRPIRIAVSDPRPLAMAAESLEHRFGWTITYEDPQWLALSEIQDVTESVRRDLEQVPVFLRNAVPRVLVPKGGSIEFEVPADMDGSSRREARLDSLRNLLMAHSAAGNPGIFRVQESYGRLNIVPLAAKDASERLVAQQPILDRPISLEERRWNGLELLEAFTAQLTRAARARVVPGTMPLNTFARHAGFYGARNEPARDFLSRFLDQVGPGYSWQLFFDPADHMYALNIHWVESAKAEE